MKYLENKQGFLKSIKIENLLPWESQPRVLFDQVKIKTLVDSVRLYGVIQPIVVRQLVEQDGFYQIIAGERRWRAAKLCGKTEILCVVRELEDREALEIGLVENLERSDLEIFEEAAVYKKLIDLGYGVTELSAKFNRSRVHIYRYINMLSLSDEMREAIKLKEISQSVAEEILKVPVDQRDRASKEILHPNYQIEPLSNTEAIRHLRQNYIVPAQLSGEWAEGIEQIQLQFPKVEVCEYFQGLDRKEKGSGYVFLDQYPMHFECVEFLHKNPDQIPSWGMLVDRYGVKTCIVPGSNPQQIVRMVQRDLVIEADKTLNEPKDQIFVHGRKLKITARPKDETSKEKRGGEHLRVFLDDLKGAEIEGILEKFGREYAEDFCSIAEFYGGEGNGEEWVASQLKARGLRGFLWLFLGNYYIRKISIDLKIPVADFIAVGLRSEDYPSLAERGKK